MLDFYQGECYACPSKTKQKKGKKMNTIKQCVECKKVFDLMKEADANEFYYGHDCEVA